MYNKKEIIGKSYLIATPIYICSTLIGATMIMPENAPLVLLIIGIILFCLGIAWGPASGYFYADFKKYAIISGVIKMLVIGIYLSVSYFIIHGESTGFDRILFTGSVYYSILEMVALGLLIYFS